MLAHRFHHCSTIGDALGEGVYLGLHLRPLSLEIGTALLQIRSEFRRPCHFVVNRWR